MKHSEIQRISKISYFSKKKLYSLRTLHSPVHPPCLSVWSSVKGTCKVQRSKKNEGVQNAHGMFGLAGHKEVILWRLRPPKTNCIYGGMLFLALNLNSY